MSRKKLICSLLLGLSLVVGGISEGCVRDVVVVRAVELGDDVGVEDETGVIDYFKNHKSMTSEQLNKASETLEPITNIFGYIMGGCIALASSAIFLITALDMLYISVPFLRGVLYSGGNGNGGSKGVQWVSDEAIACASVGGSSGSVSGAMGGGAYGGGAYGGGAVQGSSNNGGSGSKIMTYFKKRLFFVILFAVCVVVLTSSILLGTGVNLAQWGIKLIEILNNSIPAI